MMIAIVVDTDKRRHEFATWSQAEAFAAATNRSAALTSEVVAVVCRLADAVTKCGVLVTATAEYPSLQWIQYEEPFTITRNIPVVTVGCEWLDRKLIPLLDSILTKEV